MAQIKEESQPLHSQKALMRIALWANIVSWVVLVIYLLNFAGDLNSIISNWPITLPDGLLNQVVAYAGLLSKPIFGGLYFLLLQGVSQGIYLGLELYFKSTEEELKA